MEDEINFLFTKIKMASGDRKFGSSNIKFLSISKSKFFEFYEYHFWFSIYCIFQKIHKTFFGFFNQINNINIYGISFNEKLKYDLFCI